MTVNLSPAFRSFKSSSNCNNKQVCTQCEQTAPQKKEGVITKTKNGYVNFRKFFINVGGITGGVCKGILDGAALGGITAGTIALVNLVKKAPKALGVKGKIIAGVVAATTLAVDVIKAKLDANERCSRLDHRWETGHNE